MKTVDVSIYSGKIPIEKWQKIKDDGYELAVVGLFHGRSVNRFAGQQLSGAIQVGLEVASYVLIAPWTGWTGPQQVAAGMTQAQAYKDKLRFVAIDVEIDGVTEKMIRDSLDTVKELGQRPIIYTGWWWWYGHFNNSHAFSHIPLWAADYDGEANLDTRMYGGWTKAVGKQYAGTTMLHGVNVDLNFFDDEFVKGKQEPEVVEDHFAELRKIEMGFMEATNVAHYQTVVRQMDLLSHIRHNEGESSEEELKRWKLLSQAYTNEIAAIRKAQDRCRLLGRPG